MVICNTPDIKIVLMISLWCLKPEITLGQCHFDVYDAVKVIFDQISQIFFNIVLLNFNAYGSTIDVSI